MRVDPERDSFFFEELGVKVARAVMTAENKSAKDAQKIAQHLSSGTVSLKDMEGWHPFALRHGSPQLDTFIINFQSGRFFRSWTVSPQTDPFSGVGPILQNVSPEAKFLDPNDPVYGSNRHQQFSRPMIDAIMKLNEPNRLWNLRRELQKLEK